MWSSTAQGPNVIICDIVSPVLEIISGHESTCCPLILSFKLAAGDQLLVNKKHKELLESYEVRKDAVVAYLKSVRPTLNVAAGPLLDPKASLFCQFQQAPRSSSLIQSGFVDLWILLISESWLQAQTSGPQP